MRRPIKRQKRQCAQLANDAYAQAVGRGAGSVVTFEVLSEEDKRKRRDKCDVRVKVERARLNSLRLIKSFIR